LAEGQRGIYHTMTEEQIRQRYPGELERKEREGLYHYRAPGGENWPDIEMRVHSFLDTLNRDYEDKSVCIVVHGHWLILFQRLIHHFSIEEALWRYKNSVVKNASVVQYEGVVMNGKSRLMLWECIVPWEGRVH
ncbi:MAG: histidine phosphatase family protein, partial [Candidatus Sungbacteria bacterium]|nr:histidine phosphatase family protein [Candidatus Sungbacteria bacterium]